MEEADRIVQPVIGAQRVGTDQFGKPVRDMGIGAADGAHFVQHHGNAGIGRGPCRLATGQTAADDVQCFHDPPFRRAGKARPRRRTIAA